MRLEHIAPGWDVWIFDNSAVTHIEMKWWLLWGTEQELPVNQSKTASTLSFACMWLFVAGICFACTVISCERRWMH